ncbi:MAG: hypothetical protein QW660_04125 [Candidatus Bathyarchaeia archaeon]
MKLDKRFVPQVFQYDALHVCEVCLLLFARGWRKIEAKAEEGKCEVCGLKPASYFVLEPVLVKRAIAKPIKGKAKVKLGSGRV